MKKLMAVILIGLVYCSLGASAQTFSIAVNSGNPLVFQTKTGSRAPIAGSSSFVMGDSVILSAGSQVTIGLETNTRLIYRGPGSLAITGDSSSAYLSFDRGQVFLDRMEPIVFSVLTFWVKNYMFVPVGTTASIRVLGSGLPAVAVLEGKVLMQSPTGESVEIPSGSSGSISDAGRIVSGKLGRKAIAALEKWSGVKAEGLSGDIKPASTFETIDQEFSTSVAEGALPAAVTQQPAPAQQPSSAPESALESAPAPKKSPAVAVAPSEPVYQQSEPVPSPAARPAPEGEKKEAAAASAQSSGSTFEMSAGSVTVNDQQWTRIALGIDVPIWKFGVFFDIEAFLDQQGNFSNKGWDFKNDPYDAISRKIRYIRFGHEQDPLFVKVGGLCDVTFGYGFIVDRFTNMLHYPDQKLVGVQLYLNNVTPVGITLQVMGADLHELRTQDEGGLGAVRLAFRPFKTLGYPVIGNLAIGGTFAYDRNTYAPARSWEPTPAQELINSAYASHVLPDPNVSAWLRSNGYDPDSLHNQSMREDAAKNSRVPFGIYGFDASLPLISSSLLSLDLYAESGIRNDTVRGWGIGAPGVALKLWRLSASVEYRHTEGRFVPGFFGPYYLDERLVRDPSIYSKAQSLADDTLNGVFGRLGFDIANVLVVDGSYQYLIGSSSTDKDQRFELKGCIGPMLLNRIPKIKKLDVYMYKTNIGSDIVKYDSTGGVLLTDGKPTFDKFFEKTPFLYYGYRLGFEIASGATLICDNRFGYTRDAKGRLAANNNIMVQTAFTF